MNPDAFGSRGQGVRGAHTETPPAGQPRPIGRRTLSMADVAGRLEHRLYLCEPTRQAVRDGCALAVRHGLSSVIVRPEVVPTVGLHLAGTSVGVVTIPGWRNGDVELFATKALLAEARRLTLWGATDLGVLADVERLNADNGRRFVDVTMLVEAMRARGARVRVVLDTDELTPDATMSACELLGATGAWLVQGGSWRGTARLGLSRLRQMRAALPDDVTLKWTSPVRTLDSMMICLAEGVDRFNGDSGPILKDAARRMALCPLVAPARELDY